MAAEEIKEPSYEPEALRADREYVIKKLGLTEEQFDATMREPARSHLDFASYETGMYRTHERVFKFLSPLTRSIKKMRK